MYRRRKEKKDENDADRNRSPDCRLVEISGILIGLIRERPDCTLLYSIKPQFIGGEFCTRPLTFKGKTLEINYATSVAGSIRVEMQDLKSRPLPGLTLKECNEILGDEITGTVTWDSTARLSDIAGRPVRLRFVMKDADLYSLRFRE